jgi:hypothetical protein
MRRIFAPLPAALMLGLVLILSTARCTQLLGVEPGEPVPEGGALPTCQPGRASCGGQLCDTDILNNKAHCGACGQACVAANSTAECAAGRCTLTCAPRYADCDRSDRTGCEVLLDSDVQNCGACGHDCRGTPCVGGACVPIIMGVAQSAISYLAVDADSAYAGTTGGNIEVFPIRGGARTLAVTAQTGIVGQVAYSAPTLYAFRTISPPLSATTTEIDAFSRNGQNVRCVMASPAPRRLAADDAGVVWAGGASVSDAGPNPIIREVPADAVCDAGVAPRGLGGTTATRVGEGVLLDGPNAFVTALDTQSSSTGIVGRILRDTGELTVLASRVRPLKNLGRGLATDDTYVYWVDSDVFVRRVPKAGCPTPTAPCQEDVYFEEFGNVFAVNADDRSVYVLATDGQVAYLEILDKAKPTNRRRVPADTSVLSGDVAWNHEFVVWALGQKVYRLAR